MSCRRTSTASSQPNVPGSGSGAEWLAAAAADHRPPEAESEDEAHFRCMGYICTQCGSSVMLDPWTTDELECPSCLGTDCGHLRCPCVPGPSPSPRVVVDKHPRALTAATVPRLRQVEALAATTRNAIQGLQNQVQELQEIRAHIVAVRWRRISILYLTLRDLMEIENRVE